MKTLYILRHAKSSWSEADIADFDRSLNERGRTAAPFMGRVAAGRGYLPDSIVASPAKRAAETALLFSTAAGFEGKTIHDERIYEASANTLRQVVSDLDDELGSVLLVGHNPGLEDFIRFLTARTEPMATATLAVISLDVTSWKDVSAGCGSILDIIRPRDEMHTFGTSL